MEYVFIGIVVFVLLVHSRRRKVQFDQALDMQLDIARVKLLNMFASALMRDGMHHPMRDFDEKYPVDALDQLAPAVRQTLKCVCLWWIAEGVRDTIERVLITTETFQEQLRGLDADVIDKQSVEGVFEALDEALRGLGSEVITAQSLLGDPKEKAVEDAIPKVPGR